ncbi:ankyrin repeat domain-containing protein 50-like isoform X2 [Tigriopus californicus]|uniref:ankyrin repeat domain-containing protein 50-like isoform X2 n=1 Tax=Tigriopus californicus TaxID=6832 RepID=UPI0027DA279C|nr:ankyrin repeat domain-containing protein 50-like isoform X2 [Tigriopus californicus]
MAILMETRLSSPSETFEYDPPDETLRVIVLDGTTVAIQSSCGDDGQSPASFPSHWESERISEDENNDKGEEAGEENSDFLVYEALVLAPHSLQSQSSEDDTSAYVYRQLTSAQIHRDSESVQFSSDFLDEDSIGGDNPGASPRHYPNDGLGYQDESNTSWSRLGSAKSDRILREYCKSRGDCESFVVAEVDRTGKSALHYCAENENIKCVEQILEAEPDLLHLQDEEGYTPLHLSVISGNKLVLKYLISKGANVNALDNENHSSIHWATVCGELEALDILIGAGANPSNPDIHGAYPIHYAAQMCGSVNDLGADERAGLSVLKRLIHYGVPVDVKDRDGREPLMWAASAGSTDAILSLVNAQAKVSSVDKDGLSSLHCAASRGHLDCLETLITLCGVEVDIEDHNGCTPLFYAVTLGHADCVHFLLGAGANPNAKDKKLRSAAHCGAAKGQIQTLKLLKRYGSDLWTKNVRGDLPLHDAVQSGRKDLVRWLLGKSGESLVDSSNIEGRTGLHIAAMNNNVEMCKILMDHNASVNPIMRNSKGHLMTPLDAALYKGFRGCAKFIQLHGGVPASKITDRVALQKAMARAIATAKEESALNDSPHKVGGIVTHSPSQNQNEVVQLEEKPEVRFGPTQTQTIQLVDESTETEQRGFVDASSGRESPMPEDTDYSSKAERVKDSKQMAVQTEWAETQEIGTDAPTSLLSEEEAKNEEEVDKPLVSQDVKETQTSFDVPEGSDKEGKILRQGETPGYEISESNEDDEQGSESNDTLAKGSAPQGRESPLKRPSRKHRTSLRTGLHKKKHMDVRHSNSESDGKDADEEEDDSFLIPGSSRNTEASYMKDSGFSDANFPGSPEEQKRHSKSRNKYFQREFPPLKEKPSLVSPSEYEDSEEEEKTRSRTISVRSRHNNSQSAKVNGMELRDKRDSTVISVTQAVQNNLRKYQIERRVFQELLELKRLQIRAGRANEQVLVKRLADEYSKSIASLAGLKRHDGPFTFKDFERYLYDQIRSIHRSNTKISPRFKTSDDLERISKALKRHGVDCMGLGVDDDIDDPTLCTHSTHRCHHAAHAYTGEPCVIGSKGVVPQKVRSAKSKELVLPKIDSGLSHRNISSAPNRFGSSIQTFDPKDPLTLELHHGRQSHSVQLPTETLDKNKKYFVTFTLNQSSGKEGQGNIRK